MGRHSSLLWSTDVFFPAIFLFVERASEAKASAERESNREAGEKNKTSVDFFGKKDAF